MQAGLHGVCPRCGEGHIFHHILETVDVCPACHLDLRALDIGDGPAFLVIMFLGALVTVMAGMVEIAFSPPFWLHAVLWLPFILIASILGLRIFKGMLIYSQFHAKRLGKDGK
jgi:uncharacterized protein (DUF983 family)